MTLIHVIEADSGGGKGMMVMSKGRNGSPQSVIGNSAMLSCESSSRGSMDRCAAPEAEAVVKAEAEAEPGGGPVRILDQHPEFNSSADPLPSATDTLLSFQSAHCEASSSPNVFTEWRKRAQIDSALNPSQAAALKKLGANACEDEDRICAVKEGPRRKDLQGIRRNAMEVGSSLVMDPHGNGNGNGNMERYGLWKQQGRSSPAYVLGQMNRPPPSKWDDAEKWLMNSSSEQSPAHPQATMPAHSLAKKSPSLAVRLRHRLGASSRPANSNAKTSQFMPSAFSQSGGMPNFSNHSDMIQNRKQQTTVDDRRLKSDTNRPEAAAIGFPTESTTMLRTDPILSIETKIPWDERSALITAAPLSPARFTHQIAENSRSTNEEPLCTVADKYAEKIKTTPLHKGCAESTSINSESDSAFTELGKIRVSIRDVSTCMISPSISTMRDMATQITPFSSSKPSRCTTPVKDSPARHNTPARPSPTSDQTASLDRLQLENCHLAKLVDFDKKSVQVAPDSELLERSVSNTWSTKEEEEAESSKSLCLADITEVRQSIVEGRAALWEETQQAKYIARYKQEELRIQAWESHQNAKAEDELRKLEAKLEKMRSRASEKFMSKLAAAHRRAQDMLAAAQSRRAEEISKTAERAEQMRATGQVSASLCLCFNPNL